MSNTFALDIEYARVIPARFTTKRDGTPMACMTCGTPLEMGKAYAATNNSGWHSYCERCAGATQAQVAGLVNRIEALVAPLGDNVPADITALVAQAEPVINSVLGRGTVAPSDFLNAKRHLLNIRAAVGAAKAGPSANIRTNNYGGKCGKCQVWIEPGKGRIEKQGARWVTFHLDGECPTPQAAAPQVELEQGLYLFEEGNVFKVYKTRNERLAAKVLIPQDTGDKHADGTPRMRGSFQYVVGGVRILRDALAAGTAHKLTQDEAATFGQQFSFCVNCGLYLDDDRSLAAGYGPTCAKNNAWFYPSYDEAAKILGRPCGPGAKPTTPTTTVAQAPTVTVCEHCDEAITTQYTLDSLENWRDMWVDSKGEATCSGDDASGPDYQHKPLID